MDSAENFYHGFLLGLLGGLQGYETSSNRESGEGYSTALAIISVLEVTDEEKIAKASSFLAVVQRS